MIPIISQKPEFFQKLANLYKKYNKHMTFACYNLFSSEHQLYQNDPHANEIKIILEDYGVEKVIESITPVKHTYFVLFIDPNRIRFLFTDCKKDKDGRSDFVFDFDGNPIE